MRCGGKSGCRGCEPGPDRDECDDCSTHGAPSSLPDGNRRPCRCEISLGDVPAWRCKARLERQPEVGAVDRRRAGPRPVADRHGDHPLMAARPHLRMLAAVRARRVRARPERHRRRRRHGEAPRGRREAGTCRDGRVAPVPGPQTRARRLCARAGAPRPEPQHGRAGLVRRRRGSVLLVRARPCDRRRRPRAQHATRF